MTSRKHAKSSYIGRHAELYDLFYADKAYEDEAAFVHQCLQEYGADPTSNLLELACGTGRHARALEKLGYELVATDYSPDMLEIAERNGKISASSVAFMRQDMRKLDLGRQFDAVLCLFDSIGYVATNEALMEVLRGVHRHLRPGGLFLFEFWHAGAMLRSYDPLRVRRWPIPEGEVLRISETTLDLVSQLSSVAYTVYELRRDGTYSNFKETQVNRYFLVQEMAGLLSASGFESLKWFAGYAADERIDQETWHVVALARLGSVSGDGSPE
jgi:SAM-dependent methyltransferase